MKSSVTEALPVLVVDDDGALIRTLSDILRLHGYDPLTAETGTAGLREAEKRPPALAIVDLRLPDMDGIELVAKLRELSAGTEVVVLTGNASVESAVAALREKSVDYLVKPVQVEKLLEVVSHANDRWQRRRVEQRLQESEDRYRLLFDSNPQPLWVYDRETLRFLAVNDAACRHYGYTCEEFLQLSIEAIRPEEEIPALRASARAPAREGPRVWKHRLRDGTLIDVEITSHDLVFGGRPARIVLAVDVTERLKAERSLEVRTRQQARVAELGRRALALDDPIVLVNEAVALVAETLGVAFVTFLERRSDGKALIPRAWTGWPPGAMESMVVPVSEETQAGFTLMRREPVIIDDLGVDERFLGSRRLQAFGATSGAAVVVPGVVKDFGVLAAHDTRRRAFTPDNVHFLDAIAHILGTAMARAGTEAALRQTQRLEAVGRLAGGVAHDFNNMLTAITGYAELLRMHQGDAAALNEDVDEILKAARRAAGLTKQLLAFSRQQVLQPRSVNLSSVVIGMENMLRRLITEDIEMVTVLDPYLVSVKADPGQVEQVIMNLCVNARDAMPDGGTLTIETTNVELGDSDSLKHGDLIPGEYAMLAVTDTGIGMDEDTRSRIYEPFFTTKPADKGTGLGLPTVYGIVKQSGGEIWVYSEPGQGTTFKVFFPRADVKPDANAALTGATADARTDAKARRNGRPAGTETVLIAEDEDAIRMLAERSLTKAGYRVLSARDGGEAERVAAAHDGPIHLLVTDIAMPEVSGHELALRLSRSHPGLRILYLSGYTDATVERNGQLAAGAEFLQKPFALESLREKVRAMLDVPSSRTPG